MSQDPIFLSLESIIRIHTRMIEEFGGMSGVANQGLLESAVGMPAAGVGGEYLHENLSAMAAAYLFHISKNHPFFDANKRVAVVTAEVFLHVNGMRLNVPNEELKQLCLGVAAGEISKSEATVFFEKHTEKAD